MKSTNPKPHILFLAVDDLRPELNCFGKRKLATPNIDRLARRSVRYERAYCNFPICMASRASLMCGVRPQRFVNWSNMLLEQGEPTLPAHLRRNGYKTVSVGKVYHEPLDDAFNWDELHLDFTKRKLGDGGHMEQSFHDYQLPENQERSRQKFDLPFNEWTTAAEACLPPPFECADAPDDRYVDHQVATLAIQRLESHLASSPDKPLFLATGFFRPHLPWIAPRWAWDRYRRDEVDLADNPFFPEKGVGKSDLLDLRHYFDAEVREKFSDIGRYRGDDFPALSKDKQREFVHAYWASVTFMDAQVGRLLDALDRLNVADQTAIVFWGDNGYHLGEHKLWSKVTHFDESTRVPLMLGIPGKTEGAKSRALVEFVDVYPTLCTVAGIALPPHLEGAPLPLDPASPGKEAVFTMTHNGRSVITSRFRLTHYPEAEAPDFQGNPFVLPGRGAWEMFDRARDPAENRNAIDDFDYAETVAELKRQLARVYPDEAEKPES